MEEGLNLEWGIVVQARTGSSRLPNKVVTPFGMGKNLLQVILARLLSSNPSDRITLATSDDINDAQLCAHAAGLGISCFRGSLNDVLDRTIRAAEDRGWQGVVRVCADNPFIQAGSIAPMVHEALEHGADYAGYFFRDGRPSILSHCGLFAEWASIDALRRAWRMSNDPADREHVTRYIYRHSEIFRVHRLPVPAEDVVGQWRLTVDTLEDFEICRNIALNVGENADIEAIHAFLNMHPDLLRLMQANMALHVK